MSRVARNPTGWRWRLVRWLTHGQLEAVPLLPHRVVHSTEALLIKLGQEGALNTAEVLSMAPQTTELIPMGSVNEAIPDTFIALDVQSPTSNEVWRVVGSVIGWVETPEEGRTLVIEYPSGDHADIALSQIVKAYWAPMGYRP